MSSIHLESRSLLCEYYRLLLTVWEKTEFFMEVHRQSLVLGNMQQKKRAGSGKRANLESCHKIRKFFPSVKFNANYA